MSAPRPQPWLPLSDTAAREMAGDDAKRAITVWVTAATRWKHHAAEFGRESATARTARDEEQAALRRLGDAMGRLLRTAQEGGGR